MSNKITAEQIVKALRCCSDTTSEIRVCDHDCPWCKKQELTPDEMHLADETNSDGVGFYYYCDCDELMQDAADLIEEMMV